MQEIHHYEHVYEKNADRKDSSKNEFMVEVKEKNSWDGIRFVYPFNQDDVYLTELEAIPNSKNILLEAILPTKKGEIRIKSFVLDSPKKIQFAFSPFYNASSIALRISSYENFSTGKIIIKDLRTSSFFPIIDSEDLIKKIRLLGPWFHQIDLDGAKTRIINRTDSPSRPAGFVEYFTEQDFIDNPNWIWQKFKDHLSDLRGLKVLDIACNAGFYSFELAKMGANVLGIDNSYEDLVRARFTKKKLGLENVNFEIMNVDDMTEKLDREFDLILCLGLLYHVRDPKSIINSVSKLTRVAIFETVANVKSQKAELIDNKDITVDGFVPTIPWLKNAFKEAGFTQITQVTKPDFPRVVFKCQK